MPIRVRITRAHQNQRSSSSPIASAKSLISHSLSVFSRWPLSLALSLL